MLKVKRKTLDQKLQTEAGRAFVTFVFELFRTYSRMNSAGDEITKPFGLSSARWRVLGSACQSPKTVSAIARERGLTRQSVQQIVDSLTREGLTKLIDNDRHKTAKLVAPTREGKSVLLRLNQKATGWMNWVGDSASRSDLDVTIRTLKKICARLDQTGEREGQPD
jgi:DNA-binding MarR family transcriptional regulator